VNVDALGKLGNFREFSRGHSRSIELSGIQINFLLSRKILPNSRDSRSKFPFSVCGEFSGRCRRPRIFEVSRPAFRVVLKMKNLSWRFLQAA